MATHTLSTPTPRRVFIGAATTALLIGAAAATGVSPIHTPDTALLAACAEYVEHDATHRRLTLVMNGPDEAAADAAYIYLDQVVRRRVDELAGVIIATPATTGAGIAAKAKVLACHLDRYVVTGLDSTFEDEAEDHDLLAMSLARDVMAGVS